MDKYTVSIYWKGQSKVRKFVGDIGLKTALDWIEQADEAQDGRIIVQILKGSRDITDEILSPAPVYYRTKGKWSPSDATEAKYAVREGEYAGYVVRAPSGNSVNDMDVDPTDEDEVDNKPHLFVMGVMIEDVTKREYIGHYVLPGPRWFVNLRKNTIKDKPSPHVMTYDGEEIIMDGAYPLVKEAEIKRNDAVSIEKHRNGLFLGGFARVVMDTYEESKRKRFGNRNRG